MGKLGSVNILQCFILLSLMLSHTVCHEQNDMGTSVRKPSTFNEMIDVMLEMKKQIEKINLYIENEKALRTFTNVAAWKTATQSSTYKDDDANRAVDNNLESNCDLLSCSHTDPNSVGPMDRAWWQVDLDRQYPVYMVVITNRSPQGYRLRNFEVLVSESDPQFNRSQKCYNFQGIALDGVTMNLPCINAPLRGRYVRVLNEAGYCLTLCEVQVLSK